MMTEQRALTSDEREILKGHDPAIGTREMIAPFGFGFLILAGVIFVLSFGLWHWVGPLFGKINPTDYKQTFLVGSALLSAVIVGRWFLQVRDAMRAATVKGYSQSIREDLENGRAAVETHNVIRAIEIGEFEDEGAGFFLELENGQVLCVIGQDLYDFAHNAEADPEEDMEDQRHLFPQSRIEYTYGPNSGVRLDIKGAGETLRPTSIVRTTQVHFTNEDGARLEDGTFYDGPLDELLSKLNYVEETLPDA